MNQTTVPSVVDEIIAGDGLSLTQAAQKIPPFRTNRPTNSSTIFRWIADGVRLPDGTQLRLEAARMGGRWLTSSAALSRFIERQTPARESGPVSPPPTASQCNRSAKEATRELDGILS